MPSVPRSLETSALLDNTQGLLQGQIRPTAFSPVPALAWTAAQKAYPKMPSTQSGDPEMQWWS